MLTTCSFLSYFRGGELIYVQFMQNINSLYNTQVDQLIVWITTLAHHMSVGHKCQQDCTISRLLFSVVSQHPSNHHMGIPMLTNTTSLILLECQRQYKLQPFFNRLSTQGKAIIAQSPGVLNDRFFKAVALFGGIWWPYCNFSSYTLVSWYLPAPYLHMH